MFVRFVFFSSIIALVTFVVPSQAVAQVTCTNMYGGAVRCADAYGNSTTSTSQFGGGYRTTDQYGNSVVCTPIYGGGVRCN